MVVVVGIALGPQKRAAPRKSCVVKVQHESVPGKTHPLVRHPASLPGLLRQMSLLGLRVTRQSVITAETPAVAALGFIAGLMCHL